MIGIKSKRSDICKKDRATILKREIQKMNAKERVYRSLKKESVDRVPVFMWFHPQTTNRLAELLEIHPSAVSVVMGDDIRQTWIGNNYAMEGIVHPNEGEGHIDFWDIEWVKDGDFNQIKHHPLAGVSREKVMNYRFPLDKVDYLTDLMNSVCRDKDEYFIGCDISPCVFEMYWRLRGLEEGMMDLLADEELAESLLEKSTEFSVRLASAAIEKFKLDWLWTGDDVGSQASMMMSPDTWRAMVKPRLKRVVDVGKSNNLYVAYHSCGAIRPIIEDLIEIGIDVINPLQCNCPGMDPLELKQEFGSRLAFMGGVDTQHLLPNCTAKEVSDATARLIEGMTADGGGYILAASHTVPPETPAENIFAMYEQAGIKKEEIFDRAADLRKASLESKGNH